MRLRPLRGRAADEGRTLVEPQPSAPPSWPTLLVLVALAVAVRLAWGYFVRAVPASDFRFYFEAAARLAAGQGYTSPDGGGFTAWWPIGYPAFLAAVFAIFGASVMAAKLANLVLWGTTAAAAYLLGLRVGGRGVAVGAGLLVAVFPEFVFFSNLVASENLATVLLVWSVLLLVWMEDSQGSRDVALAAGSGLLMGLGAVARPTLVMLPAVIAMAMLLRRRDKRGLLAIGVFLATAVLAVTPWLVRNAVRMGSPVMSTSAGVTAYISNNAGAAGGYGNGKEEPLPARAASSPAREVWMNAEYSRRAVTWVAAHPVQWLTLTPAKFAGLFGTSTGLRWNVAREARLPGGGQAAFNGAVEDRPIGGAEGRLVRWVTSMGARSAWPMIVLWAAGSAGLVVALARRRPGAFWMAVVVGYWIVFHVLVAYGNSRFLVPVSPIMCVSAAELVRAAVMPLAARVRRPSADGVSSA